MEPRAIDWMSLELIKPVTYIEIKSAVFETNSDSVLGADGMT